MAIHTTSLLSTISQVVYYLMLPAFLALTICSYNMVRNTRLHEHRQWLIWLIASNLFHLGNLITELTMSRAAIAFRSLAWFLYITFRYGGAILGVVSMVVLIKTLKDMVGPNDQNPYAYSDPIPGAWPPPPER